MLRLNGWSSRVDFSYALLPTLATVLSYSLTDAFDWANPITMFHLETDRLALLNGSPLDYNLTRIDIGHGFYSRVRHLRSYKDMTGSQILAQAIRTPRIS